MYNSHSGSTENVVICQSCGGSNLHAQDSSKSKGITYVVLGWIFFVISLLFMPIVFGSGALLMGFLTYHERSQIHGMILMFFAASGLILGTLFSVVVAGTMFI